MKNIILSVATIVIIFLTGCKEDVVEPSETDQKVVVEQLLAGKWNFNTFLTISCEKATDQCDTYEVELDENAFMEFTGDSLYFNYLGFTTKFSLEVLNKDSLYMDNAQPSKYMIIKYISSDSLALEYDMDVESPFVNPDYALLDKYYLSK